MIDSFGVGHVTKIFCFLAYFLNYRLIVLVIVEIGLQRDDVMYEHEEHVNYHAEQELIIVRIDDARINELNKQPSPVDKVTGIFLFIKRYIQI
jgi:hypothetical protein